MAFCIRSERKMDYFKKEILNPGPGQYFQSLEKNKIKKIIHPPFHTSGQRSSFIKKEEIPGPGSYDLINNSFTNKDNSFNLNKNNQKEVNNIKNNNNEKSYNNISTINMNSKSNVGMNNNSSTILADTSTLHFNDNTNFKNNNNNSLTTFGHNNSDNINIINNSRLSGKLGFLSQADRFNEKEKMIKIEEPGPGTYEAIDYTNNIILKNKKKPKAKHKLVKASNKIEAGSLNRVISIPSKVMNGYIYVGEKDKEQDKNQKEKLKENFSNMGNINKEYELLIDKNSKFGKNMSTSEFVGPGSYDIYIKEKGNSVLQWSRGFNINEINNKKELLKTQQVFNELKKFGDKINNKDKKLNLLSLCRTNSSHFLVGKYKKGLNDINIKKLENTINKKDYGIYYCRDSFIPDKSEIPGPGYYSKELINQAKDTLYYKEREKQKIEEKKMLSKKITLANFRKLQFGEPMLEGKFGSNCDRFLVKSKSMEDLGPTTYFIEKNKFEPNKKLELLKHLKIGKLVNSFENRNCLYNFEDKDSKKIENNKEKSENLDKNNENKLSKTNKTFLNKSINDNPGPGEYELGHNFIIPSFSQAHLMDSQVERFPDIEENTPGPGAYINKQTLENEKIEEKLNKIINYANYDNQSIERMKKIEEIKKVNRKRNDFPGAGTYNPGFLDTINFKIKSKINPRQSYQSPFLISSERFKISKDDNVSPAIYDPYKYDKEQKNLQFMVFGKAKRFDGNFNKEDMKGVWHLAGPGSYDVTKNYWNKKSYNTLFSGSQ